MNVLILGYSSLSKRRLIPALRESEEVTTFHLGTRRDIPVDEISGPKAGHIVKGYSEALAETRPDLVYVSLPNALHAEWCLRALAAGAHVAVDKPAFLTAHEAQGVADAAAAAGRCVAEASVWQLHPMLNILANLKQADGRLPLAASAWFASPQMERGNFRFDPALGGGIIYDRATYAITCGRVVFESEPTEVDCQISEFDNAHGIDVSCRMLLTYPGGGTFTGFYSLRSDYRNSLTVLGASYSVDFDRVFTPPDDYEGPAVVRRRGVPEYVPTPRGSTFVLFFNAVARAIAAGSGDELTNRMARDAMILDRLRDSAHRSRR